MRLVRSLTQKDPCTERCQPLPRIDVYSAVGKGLRPDEGWRRTWVPDRRHRNSHLILGCVRHAQSPPGYAREAERHDSMDAFRSAFLFVQLPDPLGSAWRGRRRHGIKRDWLDGEPQRVERKRGTERWCRKRLRGRCRR